jgi:hypothetical protein
MNNRVSLCLFVVFGLYLYQNGRKGIDSKIHIDYQHIK